MAMNKRQRVLLYGDTLVLASIRATLKGNPLFEVIDLDTSHITLQDVLELHPDTILYDIHSARFDFPCDLILHWSGLLIGINPESSQVSVWTGHPLRELSVQDLVAIIQQHTERSEIISVSGKILPTNLP